MTETICHTKDCNKIAKYFHKGLQIFVCEDCVKKFGYLDKNKKQNHFTII